MTRWYGITPDHKTYPMPGDQPFSEHVSVAVDDLPNGFRVSTVFLSLDHNHFGGRPLLFETMVFKLPSYRDLDCQRYSTWEEALAGHLLICARWISVHETEGAE